MSNEKNKRGTFDPMSGDRSGRGGQYISPDDGSDDAPTETGLPLPYDLAEPAPGEHDPTSGRYMPTDNTDAPTAKVPAVQPATIAGDDGAGEQPPWAIRQRQHEWSHNEAPTIPDRPNPKDA